MKSLGARPKESLKETCRWAGCSASDDRLKPHAAYNTRARSPTTAQANRRPFDTSSHTNLTLGLETACHAHWCFTSLHLQHFLLHDTSWLCGHHFPPVTAYALSIRSDSLNLTSLIVSPELLQDQRKPAPPPKRHCCHSVVVAQAHKVADIKNSSLPSVPSTT